jgi:hypothetical protein
VKLNIFKDRELILCVEIEGLFCHADRALEFVRSGDHEVIELEPEDYSFFNIL